jgi:phosphotransferase system HPr (HPr) family protein
MIEKTAIIQNDRGIHVRPACVIYKSVENYNGEIFIAFRGQEISLISIMDLICLGLNKGDMVKIRVNGTEEADACSRLVNLFQTNFDFPPNPEESIAS